MKDQSRIVPKFDKKCIDVTMEPWQDTDLLLYGLECRQCPHACELHFIDRKGFSFASAAKLGAVFSSLCRKVEELDAQRYAERPVGQKSLMSLVSGDSDER